LLAGVEADTAGEAAVMAASVAVMEAALVAEVFMEVIWAVSTAASPAAAFAEAVDALRAEASEVAVAIEATVMAEDMIMAMMDSD
jgi:hypothetical protein